MDIKDEKTYNEIDNRIEELLEKGTKLSSMDFLSDIEKEELNLP